MRSAESASLELATTAVERPVGTTTPAASRRFELGRCLGSGAMGVVHEAFDRVLGQRVAVKRLRDSRHLCRFKAEFRALERTRHPNCVRALELVEEGGDWYIVMELIEGVDFLTWVSDSIRLRPALVQLARALLALHEQGLVHRDVKPANVLVTREGRVVLVDFGLVASQRTDVGECVGTPAYVAPEQAAESLPDPASDWYSVGVMLYQALTGALPFTGTTIATLARKATEDPVRPGELVAGVPTDLEALCLALVARDPAQRPNGHEILAQLGGRRLSRVPGPALDRRRSRPWISRSWQTGWAARALTG